LNNFPYSSQELNKKFNEKKLEEFKEQMAQIEKDVDPRFLEMFKEYEHRVSDLLSENLSVVASKVVQEELATQNTRIQMKFEADSIRINKKYKDMFL
jgi:cysteinyl-tRNA synthetase